MIFDSSNEYTLSFMHKSGKGGGQVTIHVEPTVEMRDFRGRAAELRHSAGIYERLALARGHELAKEKFRENNTLSDLVC